MYLFDGRARRIVARLAAAEWGDLLFAVCLLRKRLKLQMQLVRKPPRDSAAEAGPGCLCVADNLKPSCS
jgi:hypothetical protein